MPSGGAVAAAAPAAGGAPAAGDAKAEAKKEEPSEEDEVRRKHTCWGARPLAELQGVHCAVCAVGSRPRPGYA